MRTVIDGIPFVSYRGVPPPDGTVLHVTRDFASDSRSLWLTLAEGETPILVGTVTEMQIIRGDAIEVDWDAVLQAAERQIAEGTYWDAVLTALTENTP